MELGPIFRTLMRGKIAVFLLIFEIAVTLALTLNCFNIIMQQKERVAVPSGLDEDHTFAITLRNYDPRLQDDAFRNQFAREDIENIMRLPGVRAATWISNLPMAGGGSSTSTSAEPGQKGRISTPYYIINEHGLEALDMEIIAGRGFERSDIPDPNYEGPINTVITKATADALYPDGDAVGKRIYIGSDSQEHYVIGVVKYMFTSYTPQPSPMETRIIFYPSLAGDESYIRYLIRTEPDQYEAVLAGIRNHILAFNADRILEISEFKEMRNRGYFLNKFLIWFLTGIMVLLLFITGLGILGMTAFSVTRRTRQIGIRRALGAGKFAIIRYFLVENGIITLIGAVLGLSGGYGLSLWLASTIQSPKLHIGLIIAAALLIWAIGIFATLIPALRGARVEPAVATQSI